jgi:hypothetical protein
MTLDGRPVESALTEGLSHPGMCKLYAHKTVPTQLPRRNSMDGAQGRWGGNAAPQREVGGPRRCNSCAGPKSPPESELWLILEFCDKGSMQARALCLGLHAA